MAIGIAALIALAAILTTIGTGAGIEAGVDAHQENKLDDLRSTFVERSKDPNDIMYGMSSNDIDRILDEYKNEFSILKPKTWNDKYFDYGAFNQDLEDYKSWRDEVGDMPVMPDYDTIAEQANKTIDDENAEVMRLYDEMLNRSTDLYQTELDANNQAYNDYVGQVMSNQAQSQNMLQGSVRSELERSQRNAISRGANAAMKLVANINTQLGLQNQAAQQSLATSNNLAQALLNQRQAAMQLRSQYSGDLNQYTANKANLISGTAERKSGYRNQMVNEADDMYNRNLNKWNDTLSGYAGSSVWGDVHRNANLRSNNRNSSQSKYGI